MKGVVLICNHERTLSLNAIAERLKNKNVFLCAIVYDELALKLINKSSFDKIINLNNPCSSYFKEFSLDYKTIAKKDRKLKYYNLSKSTKIIKNYYANLASVLNDYDDLTFIGEISWAAEEVIYLYSKSRGYSYYSLAVARYIDRRFGFVKALSEESFISFETKNIDSYIQSSINNSKPDYFHEVFKTLKIKNRAIELIRKGFRPSIPRLFFSKLRYIFFNNILELFKHTEISSNHINYFYGFQVQPEASVDYLAPEFANQTTLIDNIIKKLDFNERLVLKDHPAEVNLFGLMRKISYLFNPKVVYIKTNTSIFDLLENISGAITITGTIGGELALNNIKTVSLKPVFYNKLRYSFFKETLDEAFDELRNEKSVNNSMKLDNDSFMLDLNKTTYSGYSYFTKKHGFTDEKFISNMVNVIKNEFLK